MPELAAKRQYFSAGNSTGKKGLHRRDILEIDSWGEGSLLTTDDSGELETIS